MNAANFFKLIILVTAISMTLACKKEPSPTSVQPAPQAPTSTLASFMGECVNPDGVSKNYCERDTIEQGVFSAVGQAAASGVSRFGANSLRIATSRAEADARAKLAAAIRTVIESGLKAVDEQYLMSPSMQASSFVNLSVSEVLEGTMITCRDTYLKDNDIVNVFVRAETTLSTEVQRRMAERVAPHIKGIRAAPVAKAGPAVEAGKAADKAVVKKVDREDDKDLAEFTRRLQQLVSRR